MLTFAVEFRVVKFVMAFASLNQCPMRFLARLKFSGIHSRDHLFGFLFLTTQSIDCAYCVAYSADDFGDG